MLRPAGRDRERCRSRTRAQDIARAGEGSYFTDMDVSTEPTCGSSPSGSPGGGAVQVARPLEEVDRQLSRILVVLLLVAVGGVALAAALGAVVARTALAPITRFTQRTESLTADPDLTQRMEVKGDDELARLARSFNTTLDALERSAEAQRQLVADASHELRTPIASLRANIQTLEDARPAAGRRALDAAGGHRGGAGPAHRAGGRRRGAGARRASPRPCSTTCAWTGSCRAVTERAQPQGGGARDDHDASCEPTLVRGDPERIGRAVSNLVDNAIEWSPHGSVHRGGAVRRDPDGARPRARVRGGGPAARVRALLPRRRARAGCPAPGWGWRIVRQAAEAHGGFAEAANAAGGGAVLSGLLRADAGVGGRRRGPHFSGRDYGVAQAAGRLVLRRTFSSALGCEVMMPSTQVSTSVRHVAGSSRSAPLNQFCQA